MEVAAAGELAKQSAIALAAVVIELHEMSAKGAKIFKTRTIAACSSKSIPVVSLAWHH